MTHLRLVRRTPSSWTLADGQREIGSIAPGRISFTGFPDAATARLASQTAADVAHQWARRRAIADGSDTTPPATSPDGLGFECHVPPATWHALQLELAQRIHASTSSFRYPTPEPAA